MKKFKLIKKYPSIHEEMNEGDVVTLGADGFYLPEGISPIISFIYGYKKEEIENNPEFWEEVKDYEILEIIASPSMWTTLSVKTWSPTNTHGISLDNMLYNGNCVESGDFFIYSVKRLSDGEIFTVGKDELSFAKGVITEISLDDTSSLDNCKREIPWLVINKENGTGLSSARKRKRKPLFTTEDGVRIFEGDEYWFVWVGIPAHRQEKLKPYHIKKAKELETNATWAEDARFFSTKEAAEEYILMDEKSLSINDVIGMLDTLKSYDTNMKVRKLIELAKSKK